MITILDTSICTENLGDEIIMQAVRLELADLLPADHAITAPTHDTLGEEALRLIALSRHAFVGGTNLLSSNMRPPPRRGSFGRLLQSLFRPAVKPYCQWKLRPSDRRRIPGNVVLLGVGWWQYQPDPTAYTRDLLRSVLDRALLHSVRDEYTRSMLAKAGIANVLNTACVTMWRLTPEHLAGIPAAPATDVVTTLTFYNRDPERDRAMLATLAARYQRVHLWLQGTQDHAYAQSLGVPNLNFIPATLDAFDRLLTELPSLDYVGTRLHAGVRALQKQKRAVIVSVDNRATEISRDTGLPVLERKDVAGLDALLNRRDPIRINLPADNIARWKSQFQTA